MMSFMPSVSLLLAMWKYPNFQQGRVDLLFKKKKRKKTDHFSVKTVEDERCQKEIHSLEVEKWTSFLSAKLKLNISTLVVVCHQWSSYITTSQFPLLRPLTVLAIIVPSRPFRGFPSHSSISIFPTISFSISFRGLVKGQISFLAYSLVSDGSHGNRRQPEWSNNPLIKQDISGISGGASSHLWWFDVFGCWRNLFVCFVADRDPSSRWVGVKVKVRVSSSASSCSVSDLLLSSLKLSSSILGFPLFHIMLLLGHCSIDWLM